MRFRASPCLEYLERTLRQLESCLQHDAVAALQAALRDCRASLSEWSGPFVIAQGDFAPWNLRFQGGRLSGILDFELAHWDHRIADFALAWRGKYDRNKRIEWSVQ